MTKKWTLTTDYCGQMNSHNNVTTIKMLILKRTLKLSNLFYLSYFVETGLPGLFDKTTRMANQNQPNSQ